MKATREQLDNFYAFAMSELEMADPDTSLDAIYWNWRLENPTPEEFADTVAKLKVACAELEAGEEGVPAREMLREACERLGLEINE